MPASFNSRTASAASSRSGSSTQITAASFPSIARYRWEHSNGRCSNLSSIPSGITHFSSSITKCQLPITAFLPSIVVEIPWATIYSTFECISSWTRCFSLAALTTALAMEWGKCSSIHAAIRRSSSELSSSLKDTTSETTGFAFVSVPVLSNTIVVASAIASIYLPPFTVILWVLASRIADNTETGMASFSAQEKSTISTARVFVMFLVSR